MKKIMIGRLLKGALAASALVWAAASSWAEDVQLNPNHPKSYKVVEGDTLWEISERFLQNPWMWPEIWHVNQQIKNPHLIYPGDRINLVYINGEPRLTLERSRYVKLSPGDNGKVKLSPSVRINPLGSAIPAIPLDAVDNFLSRSRIVQNGELEQAPYVLAGGAEHLITGAGDELYARGKFDDEVRVYGIYRQGEVYRDPETKEVLGIQALDIGTVKLQRRKDDIATMSVTRSTEEVRIEDRLLAYEERAVESTFYPSKPEDEVEALIMAVEGGVTQVGKLDVVVINRGEREGLEVGNVLAIYKKGEVIKDRVKGGVVTLPDERAGLLMVFRIFEKLSFGLVLEADRPLAVDDKLRRP